MLLSVCPTYQLISEGALREVTNRVQRLRKFMKLSPSDSVDICYNIQAARFVGCSEELITSGKYAIQGIFCCCCCCCLRCFLVFVGRVLLYLFIPEYIFELQ